MAPSSFDQPIAGNTLGRGLGSVRVGGVRTHHQPSSVRLAVATVASLVGSLAACAALAAIGAAVFPSTRGYAHFRFSDYGTLATVGVLAACLAWPVVAKVSSAPRWLFYRLAFVVSAVLLLPDVYILVKGQPAQAVAVLIGMHLAIALVTYNLLVRVAPIRQTLPSASCLEPSAVVISTR